MTLSVVPGLDENTQIYQVVYTQNADNEKEHMFCTSEGLLFRNYSVLNQ